MTAQEPSNYRDDDFNKILAMIKEIEDKSAHGEFIFRGEKEQYPRVSSGLYRQYVEEGGLGVTTFEGLQSEILLEAQNYTSQTDELNVLTDIQHFGGKTNLIDFTTDYFVALFFACDGSFDSAGRVILVENRSGKDFQIIAPPESNSRVADQKSIFIQPKNGFVLYHDQISIPATLKKPLLRYLRRERRLTARTLFNDLYGFIRYQASYRDAILKYVDGHACQRGNDFRGALKLYTEALDLRPEYAEALNNRGVVFVCLKKHTEALHDLDEAIGIDPEYAEAYNNRGNVKYELGQHKDALSDYN